MYETVILKMQEEIEDLKKRVKVLEEINEIDDSDKLLQGDDPLLEDSIRLVVQHDKASASLLQRRLSVGYARAARILDQLEEKGVIGKGEGSKPRDVMVKSYDEYKKITKNT